MPFEHLLTLSMVVDGTALVPVDTALRRLQDEAPERARVIEMRFFEGMKYEEIAMVLHGRERRFTILPFRRRFLNV